MNSLTEYVDKFQHIHNKNRKISPTNFPETGLSLYNNSNIKPLPDKAFGKAYTLFKNCSCGGDRAVLKRHKSQTHAGALSCERCSTHIGFLSKNPRRSNLICFDTQQEPEQASLFDMGEDL